MPIAARMPTDAAHRELIVLGARASLLAYETSAEAWPPGGGGAGAGAAKLFDCDDGDAQAYLWQAQPGLMVLAVRGTTSVEDWCCNVQVAQGELRNAYGGPLPDERVRVHMGFLKQHNGLVRAYGDEASAFLRASPENLLLCTGHSLGSAVAALAALAWGAVHPRQVAYAGFGNPRTGNAAFGAALGGVLRHPCLRFKHGRDPVCAAVLPVRGYKHFGAQVHFGRRDLLPLLPNIAFVADHDMAAYLEHVQRACCSCEEALPRRNDRSCGCWGMITAWRARASA